MIAFRLELYRTHNGARELVGYSRQLPLVDACQVDDFVRRVSPFTTSLKPCTKPLEREFEAFWKSRQVASTMRFCPCEKCSPVIFLTVSPETLTAFPCGGPTTITITLTPAPAPPKPESGSNEEDCDGK